jgi:hypothetical protein
MVIHIIYLILIQCRNNLIYILNFDRKFWVKLAMMLWMLIWRVRRNLFRFFIWWKMYIIVGRVAKVYIRLLMRINLRKVLKYILDIQIIDISFLYIFKVYCLIFKDRLYKYNYNNIRKISLKLSTSFLY